MGCHFTRARLPVAGRLFINAGGLGPALSGLRSMGVHVITTVAFMILGSLLPVLAGGSAGSALGGDMVRSDSTARGQLMRGKGLGAPPGAFDCGGHTANTCEQCPAAARGAGSAAEDAALCNGDCVWDSTTQLCKSHEVWCGGHSAPSCDKCPLMASGLNKNYCNGDCEWVLDEIPEEGEGIDSSSDAGAGSCRLKQEGSKVPGPSEGNTTSPEDVPSDEPVAADQVPLVRKEAGSSSLPTTASQKVSLAEFPTIAELTRPWDASAELTRAAAWSSRETNFANVAKAMALGNASNVFFVGGKLHSEPSMSLLGQASIAQNAKKTVGSSKTVHATAANAKGSAAHWAAVHNDTQSTAHVPTEEEANEKMRRIYMITAGLLAGSWFFVGVLFCVLQTYCGPRQRREHRRASRVSFRPDAK